MCKRSKPPRRLCLLLAATGLAALLGAPALFAGEAKLRVEGPDGRALSNVRAYVGEGAEVGSEREARGYARRAVENARRALQAVGYYEAEIETEVSAAGEEAWQVLLRIEPGEPVRLREVDVRVEGEAAGTSLFQRLVEGVSLASGNILDHGAYEGAKSRLRNAALAYGYFDHRFTESRIAVNTDEHWADITLVFDSGPRYTLGEVGSAGRSPSMTGCCGRLVPFKAGTPYRAEHIAALNRNLLDSGYFGDVQVLTEREGVEPGGAIPVDVEAAARDPNTLGFGVGFSTDEGPRARVSWQRHWLNAAGHTAEADLRIAQVRQNVSGSYGIPLRDPINERLQFQAGFQREDVEDTNSTRYTVAARRQQHFNSGWERVQSLRLLHESFTQGTQDDTTTLVLPGLSFSRTRSRGGVDPHWGDRRESYSLEGWVRSGCSRTFPWRG
ncbi:MAG: POTRA domain-containing protein [Arhodomonas sp.]|nr:POTRA domain-containing protein [Arhodomonas sp.]